jgi:hypothetical protein
MKSQLSFVKDPRVAELFNWAMWLRKNLEYPNSENSRDEARYTEIYEEKVLEILQRKKPSK